MGLLIGSLYYQMDNKLDSARQTFGFFFLSVMFMAMGSLIQLNITMMNKPVFYKHERDYFFPAQSYSWAMAFTQLPFSIAEATIYTAATYFMAGLSGKLWIGFLTVDLENCVFLSDRPYNEYTT